MNGRKSMCKTLCSYLFFSNFHTVLYSTIVLCYAGLCFMSLITVCKEVEVLTVRSRGAQHLDRNIAKGGI